MNAPHLHSLVFNHCRLEAFATGTPDPELASHLTQCPRCRIELQCIQERLARAFSAIDPQQANVEIVPCPEEQRRQRQHYIIEDTENNLRIWVERADGQIHGQLIDTAAVRRNWPNATVRIFGSKGFVATSGVDRQGCFLLPDVEPGQRYSLGLVLAWPERGPQLKIIGDFEPR